MPVAPVAKLRRLNQTISVLFLFFFSGTRFACGLHSTASGMTHAAAASFVRHTIAGRGTAPHYPGSTFAFVSLRFAFDSTAFHCVAIAAPTFRFHSFVVPFLYTRETRSKGKTRYHRQLRPLCFLRHVRPRRKRK